MIYSLSQRKNKTVFRGENRGSKDRNIEKDNQRLAETERERERQRERDRDRERERERDCRSEKIKQFSEERIEGAKTET